MVNDRTQKAGEGETIGEQLEFHPQVGQGEHEKQQRHDRQAVPSRGFRWQLSGG